MNRAGLAGIMDTARSQEVQRLVDATGSHIQVDLDNKAPLVPFSQWVGDSETRLAQARERVRLELRQAANDMDLHIPDEDIHLDQWFTLGKSTNNYKDGITTIAIQLATGKGLHPGATPLDSIQEFSEGISKHLRDQTGVPAERQIQWIRDTEAFTKRGFLQQDLSSLSEELRHQAIDEAFSSIAVGYATGRIMESQVPSALRSFLQAFKRTLGSIFSLASDLKAYSDSGTIDPEFKQYLDLATGFSEDTSLGKPLEDFTTSNGQNQNETTLSIGNRRAEDGKPLHSPDPKKWIGKGGTVDENWTYTDWEGNTVSYPQGYPDFKSAGFVVAEVEIQQTGNRSIDANNADKENGNIRPEGTTWHHHQNRTTMQAVLISIHRRFTHLEGVSKSKNKTQ